MLVPRRLVISSHFYLFYTDLFATLRKFQGAEVLLFLGRKILKQEHMFFSTKLTVRKSPDPYLFLIEFFRTRFSFNLEM